MALEWREFVKQEFIRTDNDFTKKLPINSINLSTYGLISEATTFVPVRLQDEVHIRPLPGGLSELRKDLQKSPRPGGGFSVDNALQTLTQFADEWEKSIKENKKWERMVELAENEGKVLAGKEYEERTKEEGSSFLSSLRNIFKF
ncbi:MAG: hypothetical protein ACLFVS_06155 [Candidatus Acetothermia bacterium]